MRNRHHSGCQTQAQGTGWTEGTTLVSLSSSSVSEPEQQSEKGPRVLRISSFTELSSRGTASIRGVLSNTPPPVPKVRQTGHAHFRYKDFTRLRPHHTVALWTQRNHPARGGPACRCHAGCHAHGVGHRRLASPRDECSNRTHKVDHINDHCPHRPAEATPEHRASTGQAVAGGECWHSGEARFAASPSGAFSRASPRVRPRRVPKLFALSGDTMGCDTHGRFVGQNRR